jgi:DNA-binding CsgD family transcriptional regulator
MMTANHLAARTTLEIMRLCHSGLDADSLLRQAARRLRSAVPYDAYCWGTIDPDTLLVSGKVAENVPPVSPACFAEHEYLRDDVNKLSALARSSTPVGILGHLTRGQPERSARYRGILAPFGLEREMRAALIVDGTCWGGTNLFRAQGQPDFSDGEAAFLARLIPHLAEALRVAMLTGGGLPTAADGGPGLVLFDDSDAVTAITPEAEHWLAQMPDAGPRGGIVPAPVYEVAVRARGLVDGDGAPEQARSPARLRLRARSGAWLVLHGVRFSGPAACLAKTAVIIEVARPPELAPLLLQAYDLTPREREVVRLVLTGRATSEIAAAMYVSPLTVQDHLKAVFAKVGVRSRRELVARLLGEHAFFAWADHPQTTDAG